MGTLSSSIRVCAPMTIVKEISGGTTDRTLDTFMETTISSVGATMSLQAAITTHTILLESFMPTTSNRTVETSSLHVRMSADAVKGSQKAMSSTSPAMVSLRGRYLHRTNRGRLRVCIHDWSHVPRPSPLCQFLSAF